MKISVVYKSVARAFACPGKIIIHLAELFMTEKNLTAVCFF